MMFPKVYYQITRQTDLLMAVHNNIHGISRAVCYFESKVFFFFDDKRDRHNDYGASKIYIGFDGNLIKDYYYNGKYLPNIHNKEDYFKHIKLKAFW